MVSGDENIDPNTGLPVSGSGISSTTSSSPTAVSPLAGAATGNGSGGDGLSFLWLVIGFVIAVGGYVGVFWGLYQLSKIGSCASGGPYVSARECPSGVPFFVLALLGGLAVQGVGRLIIPDRFGWVRGFIAGDGYIAMGAAVYLGSHTEEAAEVSGSDTFGLVAAIVLVSVGVIRWLFAFNSIGKSKSRATLATTGQRVQARISAAKATGIEVNDKPRWNITVEAPINGLTQSFTKGVYINPWQEPRVGDHVWVTYDPNNPEKNFAIGSVDRPNDPMVTVENEGRSGPGGGPGPQAPFGPGPVPPTAATPVTAPSGSADPVEKLKKLTQMRDSGLITPVEFEQKKKQLLNEL